MNDASKEIRDIFSLIRRLLVVQTRFAERVDAERDWHQENIALGGEINDFDWDFIYEWI